jgi:triosephosphate isomerase
MNRQKLIVANWKMNKGIVEAQKSAEAIKMFVDSSPAVAGRAEVVLCPPFISLETVRKVVNGSAVKLGAQNVFYESNGAYTGEISCSMLKSCGCDYVIIGHSERRQNFHETNEVVNKKLLKTMDEGLKPILCVGETAQEHQDHITEAVIEEQLNKCLSHVSADQIQNVVIAYEPVWAIGTGKNATPHQAETVHNFIRKRLKKMYDYDTAKNCRIIYGGSITPENAKELFPPETINGGLVGGASLDEEKFISIINAAH